MALTEEPVTEPRYGNVITRSLRDRHHLLPAQNETQFRQYFLVAGSKGNCKNYRCPPAGLSKPGKNQLTIRLNAQPVANASAEIVSLSGTVLKTIRLTTQQSVVDVSAMPAGVYILRYTDNDHIQTIRITKQLNRRLKNT